MPTPTAVLSEQQADAVSLIEQFYHLHGGIPTNEVIVDRIGVSGKTVSKWWNESKFREALVRRGVDLRPDSSKDLLTSEQLLLANMLLNQHDRRSIREKLEQANITSVQYHAWLRQDSFKNYLSQRAEQIFGASDHDAYLALLDTVRGGDVKAIQLFFEMRGKYTPKQQLDVNIEAVMVRVVEIVAKHVQDPEIIARIADDIEILGAGRVTIGGGLPLPPPPSSTPPPPDIPRPNGPVGIDF